MSFRYLGNKTRLADWIVGQIARVLPAGSSIADPMCGTASVSLALARAGYSVTAADALTFPVIHARTRLFAKQAPAFKALGGYDKALEWMRSASPVEGYFFREFGEAGRPANGRAPRLYFSATNAAHIDGIRDGIRKLAASGVITEIEHTVLLHHLILATNKVANISGTYGYFLRKLCQPALQPLTFDPIEFEWTPGHHAVLQGPVEEFAALIRTDAGVSRSAIHQAAVRRELSRPGNTRLRRRTDSSRRRRTPAVDGPGVRLLLPAQRRKSFSGDAQAARGPARLHLV